MAVTNTALHSQGSSGGASGSDNGTVKASYRSMYRVTCDSPLDTVDEVLFKFRTTPTLPWMGRKFRFGNGFNSSVLCKSVDANYIENSVGKFNVTCGFESADAQKNDNPGQDPNGKSTDDPFKWHDEIEVSYQNISTPVEQAKLFGFEPKHTVSWLKTGYVGPIVNSAGDPLDPTLEKELRIKVLRITKFFKDYDESFFDGYQDAINGDDFTIAKPQYNFRMNVKKYKAKFGNLSAIFGLEGNIKYYRVTGELLISPLPFGWLRLVPDRGRNRRQVAGSLNNAGGPITGTALEELTRRRQFSTPILDADGNPILDPVLLDGNGQPHPRDRAPVYFIWQTEELKHFAPIKW